MITTNDTIAQNLIQSFTIFIVRIIHSPRISGSCIPNFIIGWSNTILTIIRNIFIPFTILCSISSLFGNSCWNSNNSTYCLWYIYLHTRVGAQIRLIKSFPRNLRLYISICNEYLLTIIFIYTDKVEISIWFNRSDIWNYIFIIITKFECTNFLSSSSITTRNSLSWLCFSNI